MAAQFGDWNSECQIVRLCTSYFWAAVAWFVRLCQVPLYTCLTHWFQLCLMIRLSWLGKGTVLYFKKPRCHLSPYLLSYKVGWKTKSWRHLRTPPVSLRTLLQDPQGASRCSTCSWQAHTSTNLISGPFPGSNRSRTRPHVAHTQSKVTKVPRFLWFFFNLCNRLKMTPRKALLSCLHMLTHYAFHQQHSMLPTM